MELLRDLVSLDPLDSDFPPPENRRPTAWNRRAQARALRRPLSALQRLSPRSCQGEMRGYSLICFAGGIKARVEGDSKQRPGIYGGGKLILKYFPPKQVPSIPPHRRSFLCSVTSQYAAPTCVPSSGRLLLHVLHVKTLFK